MSSTLIETVSINYEDFSESFLTCSTCLCPYDQLHRRPKLLSCSHTVCCTCLERICQLPPTIDSGTFRCPICREVHAVPRNGVNSLPPSFLVNQLIDLMQRQRRDVVPKCVDHPAEELLFCETCDTVFCALCSDPADTSNQCHNHTIVPFSIAIKRMSEILLYKANQCVKNLNKASENVNKETVILDRNVDQILDQISASFQHLSQLLDARRRELIDKVRSMRDDKRKVLNEQLSIIQSEKVKVEHECNGLQYQVEVRCMTRKIAELNDMMNATLTLIEPRENAFLRYESSTEQVLQGIQHALQHFGTLSISRTFPAMCYTTIPECSVHIETYIHLITVDYNGQRRLAGGDPIDACVYAIDDNGEKALMATTVGVQVKDNDDGSYILSFRPPESRTYRLDIQIFGRPIRDSPFVLTVSNHHSPVWQFGSYGVDQSHLCQPVKVCCGGIGGEQLYILDTGNNRVRILNTIDNATTTGARDIRGDGLNGQSAVGLALISPTRGGVGDDMLTLNWRTKAITKWSPNGQSIQTVTFSEFVEPIDISIDSRSRILVADNGVTKVFVFDAAFRPLFSFPILQHQLTSVDNNRTIQLTCITVGLNDDVVVGTSNGVLLFDSCGRYLRPIAVTSSIIQSRILIGGLAVERQSGTILSAITDKNRTMISVSAYKGSFDYALDSYGAKLKRPSGLCISSDRRHCYVVDVGNHCVKKYRFK